MLEALRQAAGTWVSKLLLILLVISFAIWGVSGQFSGYGAGSVARVGEEDVPVSAYQRAFAQRTEALSRQLGRALTAEEARALGVQEQVFSDLIGEAALDDQARIYNLGVSDQTLTREVTSAPAFKGADGMFDRQGFQSLLRNEGLTEDAYVGAVREDLIRRQIAGTIAANVGTPQPLLESLYDYRNENRAVSYLTVDAASIGAIPEPDTAALQAYFDENKQLFRAPEYRGVEFVALNADAVARPDRVAQADVAAEYEARKAEFTTPERRRIEQIRFNTEAEAQAAALELQAQPDFRAYAERRGLKAADIDLGFKSKAEVIDTIVAEAAFAAAPNAIVSVPNGKLGPVVAWVAEVQPGAVTSLEQAAPRLRSELARKAAETRIGEAYDAVEDERGGGATLKEVAAKLTLPHRTVPAVARNGSAPAGATLTDLPGQQELLTEVFESDVGVENNPLLAADGTTIFYEVTEIIPERDRTLDEARADVIAAWKTEETARLVAEKADAILKRLTSGESLENVAAANNIQAQKAEGVRRTGDVSGLGRNAVAQAFAGPKGHVANAEADASPARIVLRVDDVTTPAFFAESEDAAAIASQIQRSLQADLLQAYSSALLDAKETTINRAVLSQLTGETSEQ